MRRGKEECCPRNKLLPAEVMVATGLEHREERTRCMGKQSRQGAGSGLVIDCETDTGCVQP